MWTLGKVNFAKRIGDPELQRTAAIDSVDAGPGHKQSFHHLIVRAWSLQT